MLCHLRHDGPVVLFYNSLESVQGVSYGGICPYESVETSVNGFCSLLVVKPQSQNSTSLSSQSRDLPTCASWVLLMLMVDWFFKLSGML